MFSISLGPFSHQVQLHLTLEYLYEKEEIKEDPIIIQTKIKVVNCEQN